MVERAERARRRLDLIRAAKLTQPFQWYAQDATSFDREKRDALRAILTAYRPCPDAAHSIDALIDDADRAAHRLKASSGRQPEFHKNLVERLQKIAKASTSLARFAPARCDEAHSIVYGFFSNRNGMRGVPRQHPKPADRSDEERRDLGDAVETDHQYRERIAAIESDRRTKSDRIEMVLGQDIWEFARVVSDLARILEKGQRNQSRLETFAFLHDIFDAWSRRLGDLPSTSNAAAEPKPGSRNATAAGQRYVTPFEQFVQAIAPKIGPGTIRDFIRDMKTLRSTPD